MIEDCALGPGVVVHHPELVNLYGCTLGAGTTVGPFTEIQRGAVLGAGCHVCTHAMLGGGTQIGDRVFIGHGVLICNDRYPVVGGPVSLEPVQIGDDVSIGNGAVLLPGVRVGQGALIGAGAVVVDDVPPLTVVVGNPARMVRRWGSLGERQAYLEVCA
jgi:acetyltransferase-like isoleucine patch superfamily enzyme